MGSLPLMAAISLKPWPFLPLGFRAYRDAFHFTGRARPREVGEFYIVSMLAAAMLGLAGNRITIDFGSPAEGFLATEIVSRAIAMLPTLPIFALMVRRIRDIGLPGILFLPFMLYVAAISIWRSLAFVTAAFPPSLWKSLAFLAPTGFPSGMLQMLQLAISVAMLVAIFIPGTEGPNRFGPDPILDRAPRPA